MPYKVKYTMDPHAGDFTAEECREAGGGCDAFVLVSMIFDPSGAYSQKVVSFDGREDGDPVSEEDLFRVWTLMAYELAASDDFKKANPNKHALASNVHELVKAAVLRGRAEGGT